MSTPAVPRRSARLLAVLALSLVAFLAGLGAVAGRADAAAFGDTTFAATLGGAQAAVAGGHPDLDVDITVPDADSTDVNSLPVEDMRNLTVDLPAGLLGDPGAVGECTTEQNQQASCPADSQVGVISIQVPSFRDATPNGVTFPLFNMRRAGPDETARLGFYFLQVGLPVYVRIKVRDDGDYGLRAVIEGLPRNGQAQINFVRMNLWGVPLDASHDAERYDPAAGCAVGYDPVCPPVPRPDGDARPFLTNPTTCGAPLDARLSVDSYQHPGAYVEKRTSLGAPVGGCDAVPFSPSVQVTPLGQPRAGQPGGLRVAVQVPQNRDPDGRAAAHLRDATVTLPDGVAINPSGADGLVFCDDDRLRIGRPGPAACPDASKVGETEIDVPLLGTTLKGGIYIRPSQPGNRFRIALVASGAGVNVKIGGDVHPDPGTGQLVATFDDTPQVPFAELRATFYDGSRSVLAFSRACGTQTTSARFTPWSGTAPVDATSAFGVDQGCPSGGFAPTFTAGTLSPFAGTLSPFTTTIARTDDDQELSQIGLDLPSGLLGALGKVPVCADAQAAAGTCGADSRLGSVTVQAGSGPSPISLPGTVSLGGPYKGAPFSLSIAVPAKAGPYDLGMVVVRSPLVVDANAAKVSAPADPLPRIVEGVPLKLRAVTLTLDRPGFMFNATNCGEQRIGGTIVGTGGATAAPAVRYQAQGCEKLKLAPSLKLGYSGRADLRKGGNPKLTADLAQTFGQAGLKQVHVTLPLVSSLKATNAKALCKPDQAAARACPDASIVGRASAVTPALHEPLSGPVYFVEGTRKTATGATVSTLPKLFLKLRGDGVDLDMHADTAVDNATKRLVTTFTDVPDAPIAGFHLEIDGGKHGILAATADPCTADRLASVRFDGQNGARQTRNVTISAAECGVRASMNASATRVRVKYSNIGAGRLVVSGRGLVTTRRTIKAAKSATVTAKLAAATRRGIASGRTAKLRLTAAFTPKGAKKAQRIVKTVRIKGASKAVRR